MTLQLNYLNISVILHRGSHAATTVVDAAGIHFRI